tara:strand:+ start:1214 stop:1348 length:135 start_codon:yes stop_codon:yes gene_type:complete
MIEYLIRQCIAKRDDIMEIVHYRKEHKLFPYNETGKTMPWNNGK